MIDEKVKKFFISTVEKVTEVSVERARQLARDLDKVSNCDNFGNNILINALVQSLVEILGDFSRKAGKWDADKMKEFNKEFHEYINGKIAEFSKSGASMMIDLGRNKDV